MSDPLLAELSPAASQKLRADMRNARFAVLRLTADRRFIRQGRAFEHGRPMLAASCPATHGRYAVEWAFGHTYHLTEI